MALGLTGCGLSTTAAPVAVNGQQFSGHVHGGMQPVSGATIQLFAPGTTGYGTAAVSLLKKTVVTDGRREFFDYGRLYVSFGFDSDLYGGDGWEPRTGGGDE